MRVALLTDSDAFAGTERHMLDLARGLEARGGVSVTLCGPARSPLLERGTRDGFRALEVEKRGRWLDVAAVRQLAGQLRAGAFDLIHAHNSRTALAAVGAAALAGRGQVVATQHFIEPGHTQTIAGPGRALRRAGHWVMNHRLDHVVAISRAVADAVRARGDVPPHRLTVIPNGIPAPDTDVLAAGPVVRSELGIYAAAPLVVCAARLEPEKDVLTLVRAMREVLAACPSARCVIAGEGSQREALEGELARAELKSTVRLTGFRTDVLSLIAAGDLFVLPSLAEPFGLVLLEAMALGKPVVAVRAGGPQEIVADGETGLLVPGARPDALAAAILALLGDPARREAMGARGRRRHADHFTSDRMAGQVAAVYQRVAQTSAVGGPAGERHTDPVTP